MSTLSNATLQGALTSTSQGMAVATQRVSAATGNAANTDTNGFKRSVVSSMSQVGGGVSGNVTNLIDDEGAAVRTGSSTDMAVSGRGFFIVSRTPNSSGEVFYTRAGGFAPDKDGNLINPEGFFLLGWNTDDNGNPTVADTSIVSSLEAVNINNLSGLSQVSTTITDKAILSSQVPNGGTAVQSTRVYDVLGVSHLVTLTWTRDTGADTATDIGWNLTIASADATAVEVAPAGSTNAYTNIPLLFSRTTGAPSSYNGSALANATMPDVAFTWAGAATAAGPTTVALNFGAIGSSTGIITQGNPANNINTQSITADGAVFGNLSGVEVDTAGNITAGFDNGLSRTFAKVALALFNNDRGLEPRAGQAFTPTLQSGDPLIKQPSTDGSGIIQSGFLESSTADTASEFSEIIPAQVLFSIMGSLIGTIQQMLMQLPQMIR